MKNFKITLTNGFSGIITAERYFQDGERTIFQRFGRPAAVYLSAHVLRIEKSEQDLFETFGLRAA